MSTYENNYYEFFQKSSFGENTPYGFHYFDSNVLKQAENEFNKFKTNMAKENERYLARHPEIRALIHMLVTEYLKKSSYNENPIEVAKAMFQRSRIDLENDIKEYLTKKNKKRRFDDHAELNDTLATSSKFYSFTTFSSESEIISSTDTKSSITSYDLKLEEKSGEDESEDDFSVQSLGIDWGMLKEIFGWDKTPDLGSMYDYSFSTYDSKSDLDFLTEKPTGAISSYISKYVNSDDILMDNELQKLIDIIMRNEDFFKFNIVVDKNKNKVVYPKKSEETPEEVETTMKNDIKVAFKENTEEEEEKEKIEEYTEEEMSEETEIYIESSLGEMSTLSISDEKFIEIDSKASSIEIGFHQLSFGNESSEINLNTKVKAKSSLDDIVFIDLN